MVKRKFRTYFRDFGYKVIRLKYFIMIVAALVLEIGTLTLYLLKLQNVLDFELFNLAILYGAISGIIVILSIGILILIRLDKKRDKQKVSMLQDYKYEYRSLANKYLGEIDGLIIRFDSEKDNIDTKIEYAALLEENYNNYLKAFSEIDVPHFLRYAHSCESDHLSKERKLYEGFSSFAMADSLNVLSRESEASHSNFLRELTSIEKSLKLII